MADAESLYDLRRPNDRFLLGILCGAPHKIPYVVQPVMSGSLGNPLSTRGLSRHCPT